MNTIDDMQNEKYFYDHCNGFEHNHDFLKLMKHSYIYISMCKSILNVVTYKYLEF